MERLLPSPSIDPISLTRYFYLPSSGTCVFTLECGTRTGVKVKVGENTKDFKSETLFSRLISKPSRIRVFRFKY